MLRFAGFSLIALVALSTAAPPSSEVASKVALCGRSTPELGACLRDRLQVVFPEIIKNGLPELDIQPSEPAYISELDFKYRQGDWVAGIETTNTKTHGISGVQIHDVRPYLDDPERFHAEVDFSMPTILIEGDYKMESNMLGIPLNTEGIFNISMVNVSGTYDVTGEHIQQDGEDYVKILRVDMLPHVGDMKVYASNLIPGNEKLSQVVLSLFNTYWRFVYQAMLPFANDSWSKHMAEVANEVFLKVPFNQIFPDA